MIRSHSSCLIAKVLSNGAEQIACAYALLPATTQIPVKLVNNTKTAKPQAAGFERDEPAAALVLCIKLTEIVAFVAD